MLKQILPILLLSQLTLSCEPPPRLTEGLWSGGLTPMNHPDITNPLQYDVRYEGGNLVIDILDQYNNIVQTRNPRVAGDTLFYSFNEPEEQVPLDCALARINDSEFSGRCTDSTGQWAQFTMRAPK